MTNTLTWNIKPIQVPKLTTNWLSVISLLLLCSMAFVTATTIAEACEELERKAASAKALYDIALDAAKLAVAAYEFLVDSNLTEVAAAAKVIAEAAIAVAEAQGNYWIQCLGEVRECYEDKIPGQMASGSCDSGSCS